MSQVKIWDREIKGKLYAVGDIHGCFNLLMNRLEEIGFDFENDLLVAVGDLVDRGIQNTECVGLLDEQWFTSVLGNHEDMCINGLNDMALARMHVNNGGQWFYELEHDEQQRIVDTFNKLPVVLEVNHKGKKYGFVHGHIEQNDWTEFKQSFEQKSQRSAKDLAIWGRDRLDTDKTKYSHVSGVDLVVMGHTVTMLPISRDNCYYIDVGAVHYGHLCILELG